MKIKLLEEFPYGRKEENSLPMAQVQEYLLLTEFWIFFGSKFPKTKVCVELEEKSVPVSGVIDDHFHGLLPGSVGWNPL